MQPTRLTLYHVRMPLEQRHQRGQLIEDDLLLRRLDGLDDADLAVRPQRSDGRIGEGHQLLHGLPGREVGRVEERTEAIGEVIGGRDDRRERAEPHDGEVARRGAHEVGRNVHQTRAVRAGARRVP